MNIIILKMVKAIRVINLYYNKRVALKNHHNFYATLILPHCLNVSLFVEHTIGNSTNDVLNHYLSAPLGTRSLYFTAELLIYFFVCESHFCKPAIVS